MKWIKLHTSLAGPGGCLAPGEHEVDDVLADALVAAGHAEILADKEPEPEPEKPKPVEVETAEDPQENREEAVKPRRRGRRRGGR